MPAYETNDPSTWQNSPDPVQAERQALLKLLGLSVDDTTISLSELRARTGAGGRAESAVNADVAREVKGGFNAKGDARWVKKGTSLVNVADYNGNLSDAIAAAVAAGGGEVRLTGDNQIINDTLIVPTKVVLRGPSRDPGRITASATFPGDGRPLVRLGDAADTFTFGARVENVVLDCNGRAAIGLYSDSANEMCGADRTVIKDFTIYGIQMVAGTSIVAFNDIEIYPAAAGATYGIVFQNTAGDSTIVRATVGVSGPLTAGIYVQNSQASILGCHVENVIYGIDSDNSAVVVVGLSGPDGAGPAVTTCFRSRNNTRYNTAINVRKANATNAVVDEYFGVTMVDNFVPIYTGDAIMTRLRHIGDLVGFYGHAPVARPAAIASPTAPSATYVQAEAQAMKTAVDAIRAALQNLGLIA